MIDGEEKLIIKNAINGEASAFGLLYDRYQPQIYRFIYLKVSHREEAEDLCHQVFLTAWQNIGNYKHRGFPFSSWLYSISKNKVVDYYRANKISINIENIQIEDNKNRSEKLLDEKINLENVKEAIKKLTDKEQNIIILRFIEGFSPKETAKILKKSEISIRVAQNRAIKKLKKFVKL
ncbi:MAG: sigma-70 family RNA polymerase sigma factor [Patescibacteria group bacterium]